VGATAVALVTALLIGRLATDAAAARDRWGERRPALVVVHDIGAGERVGRDDTEVRPLPIALVPRSALTSVPDGAVALTDLRAGEVLLPTRLSGPGRSLVAARLPRGTRGVAIPTGTGLPVTLGDHVDVLATFDAAAAGDGAPTFAVAEDALVVHVDREAVTIAVVAGIAPRVAYALAAGSVTLVLSGTSSQR
jgi:Flp pilus assembly protein CpaB